MDPDDPYEKTFEELCRKLKEFYAPEPVLASQKLSLHCKFGNYLKTELRNQFVFGMKYPRIQARLLETVDLTMESALNIACSMEKAEVKGFIN